jgi:hypothetical protein
MTIDLDDDLDALEHRLRAACRAVVPHLLDPAADHTVEGRIDERGRIELPCGPLLDDDHEVQRSRLLLVAAAALLVVGAAAVWSTRDRSQPVDPAGAPSAEATAAATGPSSTVLLQTTTSSIVPFGSGPCGPDGCTGFDPLPIAPGAADIYAGPADLGEAESTPGSFELLTRCAELTADFSACRRIEGVAGVELVHYADGTRVGTTFADLSPAEYATIWGPSQGRGPQTPVVVRGHEAIQYLNETDPAVVWQERPGVLVWVSIRGDDTGRLMSIAEGVRSMPGPTTMPNRVMVAPLAMSWDAQDNDGDGLIAARSNGVECVGLDYVDTCGADLASRTIVRGSFRPNDPTVRIAGSTPADVTSVRIEADGVEPVVVDTIGFADYSSRFFSTGLSAGSSISLTWLDAGGAAVLSQQIDVVVPDVAGPDNTAVEPTTACVSGTYRVADGDYPVLVAQKFDITLDALNAANTDTPDFGSWYPGLAIQIPC